MPRATLSELESKDDFIRRHIGPGDPQVEEMLHVLGVKSLDELIEKTVPPSILSDDPLDLPPNKSERYTLSVLRKMGERNKVFVSMIGMGYHGTIIPNVILRNVMENPGWYTAYTPYQAEVSQGRLEALLNYQQMVIDLTGMELANASLLDEATAAAEAMQMSHRISKKKDCLTFFVDQECHPQTIAVVETRARLAGFDVVVGDPWSDFDPEASFGVLIQYPASTGQVRGPQPVIAKAKSAGAVACVAADLLSLAVLMPPGEMGADIVLGSTQRFGVPMGLRRPARSLFRNPRRVQTPDAGPNHRCLGRLRGQSRLTHGAADPRAAHPPRESDQQHLHRTGFAGGACRFLRGVSRARRDPTHRRKNPPHGADHRHRFARTRFHGGA